MVIKIYVEDICRKIVRFFLNLFTINVDKKIEGLLIQIFKFIIVGGISTIIDFVCLIIFKEVLKLNVLLSNTLAFSISVIYNYWASLKFVFKVDKTKSKRKNFIIFMIFSIIGLLLNNIVVFLGIDILNIHYIFAKVFATIVVMIFNFVTRKKFLE